MVFGGFFSFDPTWHLSVVPSPSPDWSGAPRFASLATRMKLLWCITISEFETSFFGFKIPNRVLTFFFSFLQVIVVSVSFLQHVYSWTKFSNIFYCRSNILPNATWAERFLAYDIVIFDYGLMRRILGTTECVANYLDGGYMRCNWCVQYSASLILLIIVLFCPQSPLWLLWPALLMQSSYVLGMGVLTMATAPKLLEALGGKVDSELGTAVSLYVAGFCLNWLFAFILWHYYWGIEKMHSSMKKGRAIQELLDACDRM
uniref:Uncharacterized protein n=1 Tax=Acrobeloides nanus TaxID=290746 RepID=A0A914ECZ6_9BILA